MDRKRNSLIATDAVSKEDMFLVELDHEKEIPRLFSKAISRAHASSSSMRCSTGEIYRTGGLDGLLDAVGLVKYCIFKFPSH